MSVTMDEVNTAEAENIAAALVWLDTRPYDSPGDLLTQPALRDLHHCFNNGNGRHARTTANEIGRLLDLGSQAYTWGARSGDGPAVVRQRYLDALRLADSTDE